jgi:hypothetical protein
MEGLRTAVVGLVIWSSACGPAPTTPLEPLVLFDTSYRFLCGRWTPSDPPDDRSYYDVRLPAIGFDDHVAALERAGIKVFYRFTAGNQVRVDTRASRLISNLPAASGPLASADSVRDATQYTIRVSIRLRAQPTAADVELVTSLGGQVLLMSNERSSSHWVSAIIDDRQIGALQQSPAVLFVELDQYGCLL